MRFAAEIKNSLLHLLFPHLCEGCGSDLLTVRSSLCLRCLAMLPPTHFERYPGNPVEKRFYGRLKLEHATAQYYFGKESLIQHLVHQVKYRRQKDLGIQLGKLMGASVKRAGRFDADLLLPLPLFPSRERKRGYNQSQLLCEGMATALNLPVLTTAVIRPHATETQTKKGRVERWKNMEGKFLLTNPELIRGKHVLLVDDVMTTGATLEACGSVIQDVPGTRLSIATLCYAYS